MVQMERAAAEQIYLTLEEQGALFPLFRFTLENGRPKYLGEGGFAAVYEMHNNERPNLLYALKILGFGKHTLNSEEFEGSFKIERKLCEDTRYIVRALAAKRILVTLSPEGRLLDFRDNTNENVDPLELEGTTELQFILMEKMSDVVGEDRFHKTSLLREKLSEEKEVIKYALEIGQALCIAHHNNILHRDIKLENTFWDEEEGVYKLGDFGMSKDTVDGSAETIILSNGYGAPEIETKRHVGYNATADIYSFGITLYLLLNELAFPGSQGYYYKPEFQYDPTYVFPAPKNASVEMAKIIRKMCQYRPEDRYQNMAEVLTDIKDAAKKLDAGIPELLYNQVVFATETYREPAEGGEKTGSQTDDSGPSWNPKEERSFMSMVNTGYVLAFTALFFMLFSMTKQGAGLQNELLFLCLPVLPIINLFLKRTEIWQIAATVLSIGIAVFSAIKLGISITHIAVILCLLINTPAVSLSFTVAIIAAMVLPQFGFISFLSRYETEWIFLALLIVLLQWCFQDLFFYDDYALEIQEFIAGSIFNKLVFIMMIAGLVLFILQATGTIQMPEAIRILHLELAGPVSYALIVFIAWRMDALNDLYGFYYIL